ncbi:MAG: hypothetical protein JWO25_692 [Alphaproteobacteria bacterium]|nr:hypothetical protein [Alphaproteobacteria bacterium]
MELEREQAPAVEAGAFYRGMFAQPEIAFFVIRIADDGAFLFEDGNATLSNWIDRPLDEVKGKALEHCLAPPGLCHLETNLRLAIAQRSSHSYDRSTSLPDGELAWTTTLIPAAEGDAPIVHIFGMVHNVVREKRLGMDAAHHQALIDHLGLTCPNFIYLFDLIERRNCFVAGQIHNLLGYSREAVARMGERLLPNLLHPDDVARVDRHFDSLAAGDESGTVMIEYRMLHRDGSYRRLASRETVISRGADGKATMVLGVAMDVSDRYRMDEEVRAVSGRMLTLRDEERLRLAETLRDATGQHLAAADLALMRLQALAEPAASDESALIEEALGDAKASIGEVKRELAMVTFLLRPPVFDSHAVGDALRILVEGFAARSGIVAHVRVSEAVDHLPVLTSLPIFRVVQEALAEVHHHSGAAKVVVALDIEGEEMVLTIADDGIGFDRRIGDHRAGAAGGVTGMRARMAQLGGTLEIHRGQRGTTIVATAPLLSCMA